MSDALQALYAGDIEKAHELLGADDELSVFDAAAFGRVERLEAILDEDPSQVASLSDDGFTALHLAVFAAQAGSAQALIDHGADVNALSAGGIARVPPLGTAAFARSVQLARLLLDAGADVNGRAEGGFTALHSAAQNGDEELIRLLLERGADPGLTAADGRRAADFAANDGVRSLLG
jgi:ankyrin repeat protein